MLILKEIDSKLFIHSFNSFIHSNHSFFVKVVSTRIRYLHLAELEDKLFTRRFPRSSIIQRNLKYCKFYVLEMPARTIFGSSCLGFSRLFTFSSLSINLSCPTVIPETTAVFFLFFTDIARFIISVENLLRFHYFSGYWFCSE